MKKISEVAKLKKLAQVQANRLKYTIKQLSLFMDEDGDTRDDLPSDILQGLEEIEQRLEQV